MIEDKLQSIQNQHWKFIRKRASNAVVFLDGPMTEILHWCGGISVLLSDSVRGVKECCAFESAPEGVHKAVFVVGEVIAGDTLHNIKCIIQASDLKHVTLITTASLKLHYYQKFGVWKDTDNNILKEIKAEILQAMGNMKYVVEFLSLPLFYFTPLPYLMITPPLANFWPIINGDQLSVEHMDSLKTKVLPQYKLSQLPLETRVGVMQLVTCLDLLFTELGVREDIFTLGHLSRVVGTEIDQLTEAKTRRQKLASGERISLLLVDRSLDTATPVEHSKVSMFSRILGTLPSLPGHSTDVKVNISPLLHSQLPQDHPNNLPGSLANPHPTEDYTSFLEKLFMLSPKQCFVEIKSCLLTAAEKSKLTPPTDFKLNSVKVDTESILGMLHMFAKDPDILHNQLGIVQLTLAMIETLKSVRFRQMDKLHTYENSLVLLLNKKSNQSVIGKILSFVEDMETWMLDLDDILLLLIYVHSLAEGHDMGSDEEENRLISLLAQMMMRKNDSPRYRSKLVDANCDDLTCHLAISKFFTCLKSVKSARNGIHSRHLLESNSKTHTSLIRKITEQIFHEGRPDLPDIEHRASNIQGMLKSGMSLFMSNWKPRPNDNPTLLIFFIGGVSPNEVKEILDIKAEYKSNCRVLIGGTRMLSYSDILKWFCDLCQIKNNEI